MSEDAQTDLRDLQGLVATANLTGLIHQETMESLLKMALHNVESGFKNVEYRSFPCQLVEEGRDQICIHALKEEYDWVLMFDGDSTFPPNALIELLKDAYIRQPDADVVGAYAQLKGRPIPTIDTGTGTWEPIFPGEGLLPVIRTGGHFLLIKASALRRFGPPWFRTRRTLKPVDVLAEVDNYARIKFDGENPLQRTDAWERLHSMAHSEAPRQQPASVGEDSGFADALKNAGGHIYVDTNLVTGHLTKDVIGPSDLRDLMDGQRRHRQLAVGIDS